MLGFNLLYLAAQAIIVFRVEGLMFPAWLVVAAFGQVAVLAFPWFAARIGRELAGRANATINFSMFVVAFAAQYLVGFIIGLFPGHRNGLQPARATAGRWACSWWRSSSPSLVSRGLAAQGASA